MLKAIVVGSLAGLAWGCVWGAVLAYVVAYLGEWLSQVAPNWDTAWALGSGFAMFWGLIGGVFGLFAGAASGWERWKERRGKT